MTPARRRPSCSSANTDGAFPQSRVSGCTAFRAVENRRPSADAYAALDESQTFQQFSTPIPLGLVAAHAAAITPADRVLEPSAGTGLLAILAEIAGGALVLNELADTRASLLSLLFPAIPVTRFDAAQIDDHLDPAVTPSVVLMNPPFSAMANVEGRIADAAYRHVASALARLPRRRLVTITGASFAPDNPAWRDAFIRLQERGRIVFSAAIDGAVYAKHGTTFPTRLTVIDKLPADDPAVFPAAPGVARRRHAAGLDRRSSADTARRRSLPHGPGCRGFRPRSVRGYINRTAKAVPPPCRWPSRRPATRLRDPGLDGRRRPPPDGIYEEYGLQAIRIAGAQAHPTKLVQSAAMASVAPPSRAIGRTSRSISTSCCPTRSSRPSSMPARRTPIISPDRGRWTPPSMSSPPRARMRRTPPLPARLHARRRHRRRQRPPVRRDHSRQLAPGPPQGGVDLKSDKLIEDAQRDWSALGMERLLVTPLSRFPQGGRSRCRKASCLRPMPRYAPTTVARRFRASGRSSNGWAPTSTE
jgi:predicted RNA methylase